MSLNLINRVVLPTQKEKQPFYKKTQVSEKLTPQTSMRIILLATIYYMKLGG